MSYNKVQETMKNVIEAIESTDPQLVNFIDSIFTLIDGATSDDPVKKLSSKQIQSVLFKLPILAMRSPIVLGLYANFNQQITGTVVFPTPDSVVLSESKVTFADGREFLAHSEIPDTLIPADYQSGADDDNGDLPSCEMEHNDTESNPDQETAEFLLAMVGIKETETDQWSEQDYADFAKDNPDTVEIAEKVIDKATKDFNEAVAPFKSISKPKK